MPKQLFSINESYFDEIDSSEKAYILGFIFADGNVSDGLDNHYRMRITLKAEDEGHLQKIKLALGFGGEVHIRSLKSKIRKEYNDNYMIAELSISNKHLIIRLKELGVVPAKSSVKQYPNIPKEFNRDFIRGYFDGNGCIYSQSSRPNYPKIEFSSGSADFLKELIRIVKNDIPNLSDTTYQNRKTNVRWTKVGPQAKAIMSYLYNDSSLYLNRKYELYRHYMPFMEETL